MSYENAIKVTGVDKTFCQGRCRKRYTYALKNVSLSVKKGELFGLLGPNGAGKTTLLNICATMLKPEKGNVEVLGRNVFKIGNRELMKVKSCMNMCSGSPNFPWSLTVKELLNFYAMIYGLSGKQRAKKLDESFALFNLENFVNTRFDRLSSGTKQKLALAKALINDPELLFLDEPTIGLDPDIALKIREMILRIHKQQGKTVVLTTHYMKEAEELCERIAFIIDGQIVAEGTYESLKRQTNSSDLEEVFLELVR